MTCTAEECIRYILLNHPSSKRLLCLRAPQGGGTEAAAISAAALALQLPAEGISLVAAELSAILPKASEPGSPAAAAHREGQNHHHHHEQQQQQRGSPGERVAAVAAVGAILGGMEDREAEEGAALTAALSAAALRDPSASVRRHAIGALQGVFGQTVPAEVMGVLRAAAADADDDVASSAIGVLRESTPRDAAGSRGAQLAAQAEACGTILPALRRGPAAAAAAAEALAAVLTRAIDLVAVTSGGGEQLLEGVTRVAAAAASALPDLLLLSGTSHIGVRGAARCASDEKLQQRVYITFR